MKVQTFEINAVNFVVTQHNAEKSITLPDQPFHKVIRVYSDGTCLSDNIPTRDIFKAIAKNCIYRYQSSLVVDDTIVFFSGGMEMDFIMESVDRYRSSLDFARLAV